jgi:carbon storage regulator
MMPASPPPDVRRESMLVLSRKKDEKIMIADNISIMVIEIRGDKVRLGITAPKEIPVHRQEVYDAIKQEEAIRQEKESGSEKLLQ